MRYLVTGGAGFIGSNTVDELVRRGHDVAVLDDLSAGKAANLENVKPKIKLFQESITNLEALAEACRGVERVIHLAAQTSVPRSVKDPIETNRINVEGTLHVLVAARDAKVKRVVFASSCSVYGKTSVASDSRRVLASRRFPPTALLSRWAKPMAACFKNCTGSNLSRSVILMCSDRGKIPVPHIPECFRCLTRLSWRERNPLFTATASNRATLSTCKTSWKQICSPPKQKARPA